RTGVAFLSWPERTRQLRRQVLSSVPFWTSPGRSPSLRSGLRTTAIRRFGNCSVWPGDWGGLTQTTDSLRCSLLLSVTTPQPVLFAAHSIRQPPVELLAVAFRREGNSLIGSISVAGWSLYCAEAESFGVKLPSSSLSFWR